jgi:hypothetical protein
MKAISAADGWITVRMSQSDATVLHELFASAEFNNDLTLVELSRPVEQKVVSEPQQALAPLILGLGSDAYGAEVDRA